MDQPKILKIKSESETRNGHYPLLYEGLPDEAKLYAERELNETDENKANGIRKLKEYMRRENLSCPDDFMLVAVLRNCKYDISKSESKLKRFLRARQVVIKKIVQIDMEKMMYILDELSAVLLPWRDKHGGMIAYTRPRRFVPTDTCTADEYAFSLLVAGLFMLQFPLSTIYGFSYIGDNKTSDYNHFFIFNAFRKSIFLTLDLPYRVMRLDLINMHYFSRWCVNMVKPLLPAKIKKRIMFYGSDLEKLYKHYDPDLLPEEIGGTLGPLSNKHYRNEIIMFIERLRKENLCLVNKNKC